MGVPRKISLSSSSSLFSDLGTEKGSQSDQNHRKAALQMNESSSKSSSSPSPAVKIEDDDTSENILRIIACNNSGHKMLKNSGSPVRRSVDTISVESDSSKKVQTSIVSKLSNDQSVELESNSCKNTGHSPKTVVKRSKSNKNENINVYDTIAEIAASCHARTRRGKRNRCDNKSTSKQSSPRSRSCLRTIHHPPQIVTASMNNDYVPPILLAGTCSLKSNPFAKSNGSDRGHKSKISVHMLNSVGLECGDDGKLRLERFDDNDDIDSIGLIKTEEEKQPTQGIKKQKPQMWTLEDHKAFAAAIFEIGLKNCSPSIIMENMRKQPRYITRERTKSHLQKYRQTRQRSKGEFLKEFDDFFKSIDNAKDVLNNKNSDSSDNNGKSLGFDKSFKHKEPIPKVILTAALEGKKPSKLLGGKAAALLSYSVLNGFSTSHGPDQLQYKAAKFTEFPSLTEEERRSSVGASLIQVKSLIDNMTDVLLKTRHGMKPFPVRRSEIGDDESVSSSMCSSDDEYSDEDEDTTEGGGKSDKRMTGKTGSKDQDSKSEPTAAPKLGGPYQMGVIPGGPNYPIYRGPHTVYPPPFPTKGAPPAVVAGFPPPQYPHAQPSFYGGALQTPVAAPPLYGNPAGYHHPQMHYNQDPRANPYQQAPSTQIAAYTTVPPTQQNYYPAVNSYPAYYGSAGGGIMNPGAGNTNAEYPHHSSASVNVFSNHSRCETDGGQRRPCSYNQQSSSYSNDGGSDRRNHNVQRSSKEKRSRRHSERRSKHRRVRDDRATPLSIDSSDFHRTTDNEIGDFLDRLSKVPSPDKSIRNLSSSPVHRSRREGRYKSSPPINSEGSNVQDHEPQKRHHQSQFDSSDSHAKKYGSPDNADHFSEGGDSRFTNTFEESPVNRVPSERTQKQPYADRQHHSNNNDQFWNSSNFGEAGYDNQPQQPHIGGGEFCQHPAQLHSYASGSEQQQQHPNFDVIDDQQHASPESSMYMKSAQSSPGAGSATNYFFGE